MEKSGIVSRSFIAICLAATVFVAINDAEAGARRFTYVYEATTAAPGTRESENWITWGTSNGRTDASTKWISEMRLNSA